jgi:uncharacterized protein (DUF2062 family)
VPRKYFRKFLPSHDTVKQSRWIKPFGEWLHHPNLWHLHRRSVAGGVAAGLFCGLIPGPFQMICAAVAAVLFRVNLPVAMVTTLYTNPFTLAPLYMLAYEIGAFATGQRNGLSDRSFAFPDLNWDNWFTTLLDWLISLGKPLAIGLLLLAAILAVAGYFAVRVLWFAVVAWEWRRRAERRAQRQRRA